MQKWWKTRRLGGGMSTGKYTEEEFREEDIRTKKVV